MYNVFSKVGTRDDAIMVQAVRKALGYRAPAQRRQRGRVRLRTLVGLRWIAVAGQSLAVAIVHYGFGYPLPIGYCVLAIAALAGITLAAQLRRHSADRLTDREAAAYLAFDILQLAVLLYLTGGLNNPFAILILAPATVSAAALSYRSTMGLALLAGISVLVLAFAHLPLPWPGEGFQIPARFVTGLAIALVTAIIFVTFYVFRVAEESRRLSDALSAAQATLDREQRASSLGALAAAAAHELGSPLGTISLVAKELARELPVTNPHRADVDLLVSQSTRCREILAELSAQPHLDKDHFLMLPTKVLVELAAEAHLRPGIRLSIDLATDPVEPQPPLLPRRPEIMHGLGNLLQNAIEFAAKDVRVTIAWNRSEIAVTIADDGPGFPDDLLGQLGDPYVSRDQLSAHSARQGDHMGLGVFIAQNLIERTGGWVTFRNASGGGAVVRVHWPREAFDRTEAVGGNT